jgi:hypothetical protein
LVSDLLSKSLPLKKIQLWPKKIEACVADKSALLTQAQRQNCLTYFIGFSVDKHRMRGDQLNVELPLQNFKDWDLSRFQPLIFGCDILVKHFKVKELPKICFDGIYSGGKVMAMQRRRHLRETDPVRIEKKKIARLEELKAQMAEIQRKKAEHQDKKRKREVDREEEDVVKAVKQEEEQESGFTSGEAEIPNEETNVLADVLDTIQESELLKRGEAVVDKEHRLTGDLLTEDDGDGTDGAEGYESDNENAVGYVKDDARQVVPQRANTAGRAEKYKDKRSLPVAEDVADLLRKYGYNIVSDDEAVIIGMNLLPPWRQALRNSPQDKIRHDEFPKRLKIQFREKFDLVELDAFGYVIDKGDEDFMPSRNWAGRRAGFEFKVGERGLGYYRTGKRVVVPSNTAY